MIKRKVANPIFNRKYNDIHFNSIGGDSNNFHKNEVLQ